jgi:hypothetical protein
VQSDARVARQIQRHARLPARLCGGCLNADGGALVVVVGAAVGHHGVQSVVAAAHLHDHQHAFARHAGQAGVGRCLRHQPERRVLDERRHGGSQACQRHAMSDEQAS